MNQTTIDPLEKVIRDAGEGWLIDWYAPKEQALPRLREILAAAYQCAKLRLGGNAPTLTPDAVVAEFERNPHKVTAFLQVIGSVATPDFLVMVWRILQGMNVAEIRMEYPCNQPSKQPFLLFVRLSSPYEGGAEEVYESNEIEDAVILRHLGIMKMDEKPVFDGFYPLRLEKRN